MKQVVCDSGPLTHLWQIDLWPILKIFTVIHLSTQVTQETRNHVPLERLAEITTSKIQIHTVSEIEIDAARRDLTFAVDIKAADLSIVVLAQRLSQELVLTDDVSLRVALDEQGQVTLASVSKM